MIMSYTQYPAYISIMSKHKSLRGPRKGSRYKDNHPYEFGRILATLRKRKGLSQAALAKKMGTSVRMVSHWEREVSKPYLELVQKLTKALEVPEQVFSDSQVIEGMVQEKMVSRALMRRLERAKSLTLKGQKALQDYIDVLIRAEEAKP
jgi:transcriptional regulator with XRE-family HTH domain